MKSTARQAADALDKLHKIGQACDAATEKATAAIRERYSVKARDVFDALPADVQLAVNHLRNIGVDVDVKSEEP